MKRILITNDDGIQARGLRALTEVLSDVGEVYVVAPDREKVPAVTALPCVPP